MNDSNGSENTKAILESTNSQSNAQPHQMERGENLTNQHKTDHDAHTSDKSDPADPQNHKDQDAEQPKTGDHTEGTHSEDDESPLPIDQEILALKRRTIVTEFGTVLIDANGIHVEVPDSEKPKDAVAAFLGDDKSLQFLQPPSQARMVGSRMYMLDPTSTASRVLVSLAERQCREERGVWSSDIQLMLVTVSALLTVRMMLTMPRQWLTHGGVSFQVAYLIFCFAMGLPLLHMEAALGQYAGYGLAALMPQIAPALKGYSLALVASISVTLICAMPELAAVAVYGAESMHAIPPWTSCQGDFNTMWCYNLREDRHCNRTNATRIYFHHTCMTRDEICSFNVSAIPKPVKYDKLQNNLAKFQKEKCKRSTKRSKSAQPTKTEPFREEANHFRISSHEEYFSNVPTKSFYLLKNGMFAAPNIFALMVCWFTVGLLAHYGIMFVPSVLPVLLGLPLLMLTALGIQAIVIGATNGLDGLWSRLIPDVLTLSDPGTWFYAALQAVQSLNIGTGINAIAYSHNQLTHDCKKSALKITLIVVFLNFCVGICYMFILNGHAIAMGMKNIQQMLDFTKKWHPLVVAVAGMSSMYHHRLWTPVLMLAVVLLGLGTCQVMVIVLETSCGELGIMRCVNSPRRTTILCVIGFVIDLLFVVNDGFHVLALTSHYAVCRYSIILAFLMVITVEAILGQERLLDNMVHVMSINMSRLTRSFLLLSWRFVCTIVLALGILGSVVFHVFDDLQMPQQADGVNEAIGVVLLLMPTAVMIGAVFYLNHKNTKDIDMFAPTSRWRPGLMTADSMTRTLQSRRQDRRTSSSTMLMQPATSIMTRLYGKMSVAWSAPLATQMSFAVSQSQMAPSSPTDQETARKTPERLGKELKPPTLQPAAGGHHRNEAEPPTLQPATGGHHRNEAAAHSDTEQHEKTSDDANEPPLKTIKAPPDTKKVQSPINKSPPVMEEPPPHTVEIHTTDPATNESPVITNKHSQNMTKLPPANRIPPVTSKIPSSTSTHQADPNKITSIPPWPDTSNDPPPPRISKLPPVDKLPPVRHEHPNTNESP